MLIHSAVQLLTIKGSPQRGDRMGDLGIIQNGAVMIDDGQIVDVGESELLINKYPDEHKVDASNRVVIPGFVDPHTHLLWADDRAAEFKMRLEGKTYLEILASGGGILSTVEATRSAPVDELIAQTRPRINTMFDHGTTTVEIKTGYGLDDESELKMLAAIMSLGNDVPMDVVPTYLGAHAIPSEYKNDPEGYTAHLCTEMLPSLKRWWQANAPDQRLPYVDVFCERGAFNLTQSRRILETARNLGFDLKIHADEFDNLGGARLAAELGAVSADHLVTTSLEDIRTLAESDTVAVALPCTPFGLAETQYTPAADILAAGGLLALATDTNPGTAWCESMQFAIALACRYMRLTPAQAIVASTINSAAAVGLADKIGSIEIGKQADIVLLDIPEYNHLGYRFGTNLVHSVIKRGRLYPVKGS